MSVKSRLDRAEKALRPSTGIAAAWICFHCDNRPAVQRTPGDQLVYQVYVPCERSEGIPKGTMFLYRMPDPKPDDNCGMSPEDAEIVRQWINAALTPEQRRIVDAARAVVALGGGSLADLAGLDDGDPADGEDDDSPDGDADEGPNGGD